MSVDGVSPLEVIVLGASGFLGQHVVRALGERALPQTRRADFAGSTGLVADLADEVQVQALLESMGARALINCAALSSPAACLRDAQGAAQLNTELPRILGEWAARVGARVVHVSTDLVFGAVAAPAGGFREEDEPGPVSLYGETKAAGEEALLVARPEALVVRLPLLYGDGLGTGRGASEDLLALLARGERPRLFTDEWRTPLGAAAAARALVECLDLSAERACGHLHVAGTERASRLELGLAIHARRFGDPERAASELDACLRADLGLEPLRPEDTSLCVERARGLLEAALPDLVDGVREAVDPA